MQTDLQTDMTKLIVAFRNSANASKNAKELFCLYGYANMPDIVNLSSKIKLSAGKYKTFFVLHVGSNLLPTQAKVLRPTPVYSVRSVRVCDVRIQLPLPCYKEILYLDNKNDKCFTQADFGYL